VLAAVQARLARMREARIWPNGLRYLWTDAFGVVLLVSLWHEVMLWMSHFFPDEPWAVLQRARALAMLEGMWIDPPGYFCREPTHAEVKFAFTNYGVSLGLQAVRAQGDRVRRLNAFFDGYRSGDEYVTVPPGGRSIFGHLPRTVITGHFAVDTTRPATLPRNSLASPVRPCVPTMIMSARGEREARTICSCAMPSRSIALARTPAFLAFATRLASSLDA
jgi:hypothetical protein